MRLPLLLVLAAALPAAAAEPPRLEFPLACAIGESCWPVGYVDHGVGGKTFDYQCGHRTSEDQTATEFAVRDMVAVAHGIPVLAMAAGKVASARDGMADGGYLANRESVRDRDCGNGIVIDHGGGWQTQYCHLRQGSIAVAKGQAVEAGQPIAMVGMSGRTELPLLAVEVRQARRPVDPFLGLGTMKTCGLGAGHLWSDAARRMLAYRPADIAVVAFSDTRPTDATVTFGAAGKDSLTGDAPAMLLWTRIFGARPGDELTLRISGPDDQPFAQDTATLVQAPRAYTRFAGAERKIARWPAGTYTGLVTLRRRDADGRHYEWMRSATVDVR